MSDASIAYVLGWAAVVIALAIAAAVAVAVAAAVYDVVIRGKR